MILDQNYKQAKQKAKIACKCDYCGDLFERLKHNIERSHKHISKDSCSNKECIQKKRISVNKLLFGVENAFQNEEIKEKIKETNQKKYGVPNAFQSKKIQEKQRKTCKEKYGTESVFQNEKIKEKIKETNQKKYGVPNAFQSKKIQEKQRKTMGEKHGVEHALQSPKIKQKAIKTCISNFGSFPAHKYGKAENEIKQWINSFGFNFQPNYQLIPGKEIDLYDPNKNLAIEYCGLMWHHETSPEPRGKYYHSNKRIQCLNQGVQLLTIFSDEWLNRQPQCQSRILSILGIGKRIYARKCQIKELNKHISRKFFNDYHIQGANNLGLVYFGIFDNDELCGVMSLGRHNRQSDSLTLDRLCFKRNIQVVGGSSKLLSRCIKWAKNNGYNEIVSFSDNRWSLGKVYEAMGFNLDKEYPPDYSYVNKKRPTQRISKQSQKKSVVNCPANMTELEWATARDLSRIWDCGKKRWIRSI